MNNWNINPEKLLKIPGNVWVYWKDIRGNYLGSNDRMAEECDLSSCRDIIGRSDYDFKNLSKQSADIFIHEDRQVMSYSQTKDFQETVYLRDTIMLFHTIKMPLYEGNHQLAGIVGISYRRENTLEQHLSDIKQNMISKSFSKRENDVLYYLLKGKTLKATAVELGLSTRTVESYLANMKSKSNVATKGELIEMTINNLISQH